MSVASSGGLQTGTAAGAVERLNAKHQAIWNPDQRFDAHTSGGLALRTYRAISWLMRADREQREGDLDIAFVLYWIAFNAAYARDVPSEREFKERARFADYFAKLLPLDANSAIHGAIWNRFSGPVRILLDSRYLYGPFWDHVNGEPGNADWETRFNRSKALMRRALGRGETETVLSVLFDRLYTLRNQLMHGGATQGGSLNQDSVRDGTDIMSFLVPVFIEIMLDHPGANWGPTWYPPRLSEQMTP